MYVIVLLRLTAFLRSVYELFAALLVVNNSTYRTAL